MVVKFEPVPEEEMRSKHHWYTFCEVQREIFRMADKISDRDLKKAIQLQTRLAIAMAKPLAERIEALDPKWPGAYYGKIGDMNDYL